ncbi:FIST C-terminal domain-containing protein [soil metagenome]
MPFAAALSEHPLATHAVGEVVGQVLDSIGFAPDLAVLFVTAPHGGALEDVARTVREVLRPGTLLAATAASVLGGDREVEEQPAVTLWGGRLGDDVVPVRLEASQGPEGVTVTGLPREAGHGRRTLLVLADPFSFPSDHFLDTTAVDCPELTISGGMASAARGPGGNRLVLDEATYTSGAVGVLLPAGQSVTPVVSQGCRPIGDPMIVPRAEGNVMYELAGKPALERLVELVSGLGPDERALAQRGIHLGRVINEGKLDFERGDFLIRNVLGGDRDAGAIAVGDEVEIGATVQFQVRDADSADEDLRAMLAGKVADGALVFTCNGRGTHLFGRANHDAEVVAAVVSGGATAGMFCAGELGPVGGRSFVHGFTASVVLFHDVP